MRIRELTVAVAELDEALAYYGSIRPRLAADLLREIQSAKRSIMRYPAAWKPLPGGLRSFAVRRFPYTLVYRPGPDEILVVAYAHQRRGPDYWRDRCSGFH